MFRNLVVLPLLAIATPAVACYNSEAGEVRNFSNKRNISVTVDGAAKPTSDYGNSWGVKRDKSLSGTGFYFGINMDKEESGINGILLSFHPGKPIVDWVVGDSQTFKPYKSLGSQANEQSYGYFTCGAKTGSPRKFHDGYFGAKMIYQTGASSYDMQWFLDSSKSTATLTAVEDGFTSRAGEFSLSGTLNLVLVRAESDRWSDGEKIKETGERRNVSIKLDKVQFVKAGREGRR